MSTGQFKVKAIYEYSSPHDDDLSFPQGQVITVTEEEDDEWYSGEFVDSTGKKHQGIFPRNFVDKYEPEIPSRPTRPTKSKREVEISPPATSTVPTESTSTAAGASTQEWENAAERSIDVKSQRAGSLTSPPPTQPTAYQPVSTTSVKSVEQPPTKPVSKAVPAEVSDKPSGGSFKDRIAAFNKPAAPPVAPFKPGGQGTGTSTGFIKKPFVAPPPSKNAYVPPPRDPPPAKVYRREEEAELNETAEDSEASMPLPGEKAEAAGESQPKPTSLKDRIALLQKQQLEQAARHAEAAQKKEKPKRPLKKRTDSQEPTETLEGAAETYADAKDPSDAVGKKAVDFADDESEPLDGQGTHQRSNAAYMSTPPPPSRELMSDTNDADNSAAGDTEEADDTSTSREDNREKPYRAQPATGDKELVSDDAEPGESDEAVEEEQDVDPEIKRRMEIRERMAKMSGGMGLMGMFGPPGGMPTPVKKAKVDVEVDRDASGAHGQSEALERAAPVPVPGLFNTKISERLATQPEDDSAGDEDARQTPVRQEMAEAEQSDREIAEPTQPPQRSSTDRAAPPVPQGRAVPPPPPRESRTPPPILPTQRPVPEPPSSPPRGRAAPLPPSRTTMPLSPGELSDDEMSVNEGVMSQEDTVDEQSRPQSRDVPSLSTAPPVASRPGREASFPSPASPTSPTTKEKKMSRGPPPLPPSSPITSPPSHNRAPPPPPPGQPPSRKSTSQSRTVPPPPPQEGADDSEGEVTEYDGDYDTDIASGVKHKDALKSHARDSSLDDDTVVDATDAKVPGNAPGRGPPPLPNVSAPRDVPPFPPIGQTGKPSRKSGDMPRVAPPPVPPPKEPVQETGENSYDPYRYHAPEHDVSSPASNKAFSPVVQPPYATTEDDDLYGSPPPMRTPAPLPGHTQPFSASMQPPQPHQIMPRQSLDISRSQATSRRSMEVPRPSGELGFMATDVDLDPSSQWYAQTPDVPPPSLQQRNDILFEIESSTSSKRGGKTTVSKDIYILYMDYSQTIITTTFDASDPTSVTLEQRHERPPPPPRQDQLEAASTQFGTHLASSAPNKSNATIGDGSAHALILDLLRPLSRAILQPIGTRAYGAPVYANLANASTQQFDEIRPGDIVTFRNAKFAGHQGRLHTKYSVEVGRPDHVAVVADWDGTKKKIRVWEQKGKEGGKGAAAAAKVKEESYRVADLKSGEVRVWRVMGRGWVGWESGQK